MKNAWIFNSLMAAALLIGCDSDNDGPGGQAGGSSGQAPQTTDDPDDPPVTPDDDGEPDTLSGSSTGEPDDSDTEPDGEDTEDCSFIECPTDSNDTIEPACDLWAQDCPVGEKCMPWANAGGPAWNDARCTPLDSQPGQPGDACTVEGQGDRGQGLAAVLGADADLVAEHVDRGQALHHHTEHGRRDGKERQRCVGLAELGVDAVERLGCVVAAADRGHLAVATVPTGGRAAASAGGAGE